MAAPSTSLLPPPPIREPIFSGPQFAGAAMAQIWVNWFTQLFNRAGQGFAPTQNDLEIFGAYSDISNGAVASQVANLRSEVAANTANIAALTILVAAQAVELQELEVLSAFIPDVDHS